METCETMKQKIICILCEHMLQWVMMREMGQLGQGSREYFNPDSQIPQHKPKDPQFQKEAIMQELRFWVETLVLAALTGSFTLWLVEWVITLKG